MREESWGQILSFLFTLLLCEVTLGMADLKKKKKGPLAKKDRIRFYEQQAILESSWNYTLISQVRKSGTGKSDNTSKFTQPGRDTQTLVAVTPNLCFSCDSSS